VTALAVKKLEHHAVDPKFGLGLPSPFDEANPYKENIEKGLNYLFANCAFTRPVGLQMAGDPDTDGDGIGVYFSAPVHHRSYNTAIALMAICQAVEMDRVVENGNLTGWTYEDVARDTMDYLLWSQMDPNTGNNRGGWGYAGSDNGVFEQVWDRADNSNAGWVVLGLAVAEAAPPEGCGFTIPRWVKDELVEWIEYIQCDPGDPGHTAANDGGSGYEAPCSWVNTLKTGNLLQQMAFVGWDENHTRVQRALKYMHRHWGDPNQDPGWSGGAGTASYHATFTIMKGMTALAIHEFCDPPIDWQADFEEELLAEQMGDGGWPLSNWGDRVLSTIWALLTLQKAAPIIRIPVPVDIKPTSCPNPLNVKSKGVLPVAILGTEDLDVSQIDPASVRLAEVAPLRWAMEDVATPYEPYIGKEGCMDCTTEGPDGYTDLTLKFNKQEIVAALGDVSDGDCLVLELTGSLLEEFNGRPIAGEDVVWIIKKGGK
jgi:hypothetical protein